MGKQGELPGLRLAEAEIGIQSERRHPKAKTIGANDAKAIRTRRIEHGLPQVIAESSRDDDDRARSFLA